MKLSSEEQPLAIEIRDPEIREHTVASQIKIGIPFQIRAIREKRGLTQEDLAQKIGTTQNTISRLENPKTGKPTIKTLLRLARAFDVALLVRFVPFGFYGDVINATDSSHIEIPSYDEEFQEQQKRDQTYAAQKTGAIKRSDYRYALLKEPIGWATNSAFSNSTKLQLITSKQVQVEKMEGRKEPETATFLISESTKTTAKVVGV